MGNVRVASSDTTVTSAEGKEESYAVAAATQPINLDGWDTGWASMDPQVRKDVDHLVQLAQERVAMAQKDERKAVERAQAAEQKFCGKEVDGGDPGSASQTDAGSSASPAVIGVPTGDHGLKADSSVLAHPVASDVINAQRELAEAQQRSRNAESEADDRVASAAAAEQRAGAFGFGVRGLRGQQAAWYASSEATLAEKAMSKAEMMHLRVVVAREKVQLLQLSLQSQAQRGLSLSAGLSLSLVITALLVLLHQVKRRVEPTLKELNEPLAPESPYEAPEWTMDLREEASAEEWQQRALAAQEAAARSRAASGVLREAATVSAAARCAEKAEAAAEKSAAEAKSGVETAAMVKLADAQEQLSAATRRAEKAEAAAKKSAAEAKTGAETAAAAAVATQKAREEAARKGASQVEDQLRDLQERLEQIAETERRCYEEKRAAQAAAQEAQAALERLQMQVDPAFVATQDKRVESAEACLAGMLQEIDRAKAAKQELASQLAMSNQKVQELEGQLATSNKTAKESDSIILKARVDILSKNA